MYAIKKALAALVTVGMFAGLAACGGATGDQSSGDQGSGDQGAEGQKPLRVEGSAGTVRLDRPATEVVALEWSYAEDLVALGVQPVGVADKKGYAQWVTAGPNLQPDVQDVGLRQEPSMESIRALNPDLIIGIEDRDAPIADQLQDIAPTVMFDPTQKGVGQWEEMRQSFLEIGKAVGKTERAKQVLADLDRKVESARADLKQAGKDGAPVALAQGFTQESAPTIRMFTDQALAGHIIEELGLQNAWKGKPDPWGFTTVDVEALTSVSKADFMYVAEPEDNIFTGALADNRVWKGLGFVRTDRVHALDPGTWFFGGPLSSQQIIDEFVKALR